MSTDPSQDTLFRTMALTMVVTFVVVASTLLLDHEIDRPTFEGQANPVASAVAPAAMATAPASSAAPAAATSGSAQMQALRAATVDEGEMYLRSSATDFKAGLISFVVTNDGTMHHEFVIVTGDPTGTTGDEPGRVSEANHIGGDSGPEIGDIAPGHTKVLTVKLAPGTYTAMCNLPGHYAAGMHFQFTVE